ncbi:NTPase [Phorcysia thermohydrogeniphila]|uniref:Nucleoside-triphosphatase n=1 Tax=Phorcysia thermohydrogeniphila TaxID=936138 RepID=A0A4R1GHZ5_9BACT|nr:NTPase [Phorcysia thermohydrogeniphila]TCK06435.1 nucleoside-triphosphatase [Phorcysia thermohydrogeniphila]
MSLKVVLTGKPGVGKTTAVKRVVERLGEKAVGFWTEEIRKSGKRWGFKVVRTDGEEELLASVDFNSPFRVGRYRVNVEGFEETVVPFLERALTETEKVLIVDEVGKMELLSQKFVKLVEKLLNSENRALLTIPVKDVHPIIRRIRSFKGSVVISLTVENRDSVPDKVLKLLEEGDG